MLSTLHDRLADYSVDHGDGGDHDADDPMAALSYDDLLDNRHDADDDDIGTQGQKERRVNIKTNTVVRVGMPELCPTARAHGDGRERMVGPVCAREPASQSLAATPLPRQGHPLQLTVSAPPQSHDHAPTSLAVGSEGRSA